jgi:hypothetical protein
MLASMLLYRFIMSMTMLSLLGGVSWVILTKPSGQDDKLVYALLTGVIAVVQHAVGWWFNSSLSSTVAAKTIAEQSEMLARSTPVTVMEPAEPEAVMKPPGTKERQ